MECPQDTIFNPVSRRCVDINAATGRLINAVQNSSYDLQQPCRPNLIYHPIRDRCVSKTSRDGRLINAVYTNPQVECPTGQVFNTTTGRCVSAIGPIASSLYGKWNCLRYGERPPDYQFTPLQHQIQVAEYFLQLPQPGILLYWSLGSGKTCGAITILDHYINVYNTRKVYIFSTGSLRENFLYQYCMLCGEQRDRIRDRFEFISYNYSFISQNLPSKQDMDGSLIIIDEVQYLINGYRNESQNYVAIYDLLLSLDDARFILLSGTPVTGYISELYYILQLIKPSSFSSLEQYNSFFDPQTGIPRPDFLNRISDVISHVPQAVSPEYYPTVYTEYAIAPLTPYQYNDYLLARQSEDMAFRPNARLRFTNPQRFRQQNTRYYLAYSMLRSRQRCNMSYPEPIRSLIKLNNAPPDYLEQDGGWVNQDFINNLYLYAPKFWIMLQLILQIPGKHVVYSEFKQRYGVWIIDSILRYYGITTALFTGDLNDAQRNEITTSFNSPENLNGENTRVLLITEAGAVGQNFLQVRAMHIMEQSVNESDIQQAIGRVVRYGSHIDLPPDQRTVSIYRYFAITPGDYIPFDDVPPNRQTSDFYAYARGMRKIRSITPLLDLLKTLPPVPLTNPVPASPAYRQLDLVYDVVDTDDQDIPEYISQYGSATD